MLDVTSINVVKPQSSPVMVNSDQVYARSNDWIRGPPAGRLADRKGSEVRGGGPAETTLNGAQRSANGEHSLRTEEPTPHLHVGRIRISSSDMENRCSCGRLLPKSPYLFQKFEASNALWKISISFFGLGTEILWIFLFFIYFLVYTILITFFHHCLRTAFFPLCSES